MNTKIFREYDIRGVVKDDLQPEVVELLGKGIGTYLKRHSCKTLAIGRDCRLSSPELHEALLKGLKHCGFIIEDVGVVPTPLLYFSVFDLNVDCGVMITGSHNPPDYNGLKICLGKSTIYGSEIQKIRKIIEDKDFENGDSSIDDKSVLQSYKKMVAENIKLGDKKLKVVLDAGNGTGGVIATPLFKSLGCEVIELNCEMDGNFPNHHPDPTVEKNLYQLREKVLETSADVGIAYDGDADRIGALDEKGSVIWGDKLMILFARSILKDVPGATFIGEVKCSQTMYDDINSKGGNAIMWKTGHSLIKAKMKEEKAELAGEMSGHIFFKNRYYGFDDAIYASGRLLEILSNTSSTLSELLSDIPKVHSTPEIRVECTDELKFKLVDKVKDYYTSKYNTVDVDGVRVLFENGWGLVRASNTQPVIVTRFEANTPHNLQVIQQEMESTIEKLKSDF